MNTTKSCTGWTYPTLALVSNESGIGWQAGVKIMVSMTTPVDC